MKTQDCGNSVDGLIEEILGVCGRIQRAEYRLLELIRQLDEAKGWAQFGMPSCAHWLNWRCGIDLVTAREKVRVAHALQKLPMIREAFREGRLSYSKVRAITRVATAESEAELLELAEAMTAAHVEQLVKRYRQAERLQESRAAFASYRHRNFTCHYDEDGSLVFEGRLPAEVGALLLQALDRGTEWLMRGERIQTVPLPERRADALAALAERFLEKSPEADDGFRSADRFQVVIHASAEALPEYGPVNPDDPPQVQGGPVLSTETVRRLTCDCAVVPLLETKDGEPLNVGRKTRVIPPAIDRALKRRDQGCRFPGCVNTRFVDGHHIVHWADGGETSLHNTVLLCRRHHRLVHEGGYYIVKDGCEFMFFRGDGWMVPKVASRAPGFGDAKHRARLVVPTEPQQIQPGGHAFQESPLPDCFERRAGQPCDERTTRMTSSECVA